MRARATHPSAGLASAACLVAALAGAGVLDPVAVAPAASGAAVRQWRCLRDVRAIERLGDSLYVGTGGGLVVWDLLREMPVDTVLGGGRLAWSAVGALRAASGRLYVGTDAGVTVREPDGFWHAWPPPSVRVPRRRIRRIDVAPDGRVFVSSAGGGVGVVAPDSSRLWTRADSLLSDQVHGVAVSPFDGTVYFATAMGLCARRDSVWVNFQAGAGIPRGQVRAIAPLPDDRYALLVGRGRVLVFDGAFASDVSPGDRFPESAVAAIDTDRDGRIWAAGRFGGLATWSGGGWVPAAGVRRDVLAHPWRTLRCDSTGGVFVGAADGTILRVEADAVSAHRLASPLPAGRVDRLVVDTGGALWLRCAGRLWRLDPARETAPRPVPEVGEVADVAPGPDGSVWACGARGVHRVAPGPVTAFEVDTRERDPDCRALAFDASGSLWVATGRGNILRFDGLVWMRMGTRRDPGGRAVRLAGDGEGGMWTIAPYGGPAAARRLGDAWKRFDAGAFGGGRPVAVARAPGGVLVVATATHLYAFDPRRDAWRPVHARPTPTAGTSVAVTAVPGERFGAIAFDPRGTLLGATTAHRLTVRHGVSTWRPAGAGALAPVAIAATDSLVCTGHAVDGLRVSPRSRW